MGSRNSIRTLHFILQIIVPAFIKTTGFAVAIIASLAVIGLSGLIMLLVYKSGKSWGEPNTKPDPNLLDEDGYMKNQLSFITAIFILPFVSTNNPYLCPLFYTW